MAADPTYDVLGWGYRQIRRPDPRLAAAIWGALGNARTVVNVGAGAGSYEPPDRWVLAVEPSDLMISQRAPDAAPVMKAAAEILPLTDETLDAAMAILTVHHWQDQDAGIQELLRVVRQRIVIVTIAVEKLSELWIVSDYFPELLGEHAKRFPTMQWLGERLPGMRVKALPVPRDCQDQFMAALWARPHAYLDPAVRAATSPWYDLPGDLVEDRLECLRDDLESGRWRQRHRHLLDLAELDVGLRLVTAIKPGH